MKKNYIAELKVIGPLFIGSGQEIKKSEYIYDRNSKRVYVMDVHKMFDGICKLHLQEKYERFIFGQFTESWKNGRFNTNNKPRDKVLLDFIRDQNIKPEVYRKWASYSYILADEVGGINRNNILANMKDPYGKPFVPGSSLKGALVNCLLGSKLMAKDNSKVNQRIKNEEYRGRGKYLSSIADELTVKEFHKMRDPQTDPNDIYKLNNPVNSILRGLVVGDSLPLSTDDIILCQKIDIHTDGSEKKMPILRECIKPGTSIRFPVHIDTDVFPYDSEQILDAVKKVLKSINMNYLDSFPKIPVSTDIEKAKLYLGGGTGFPQKTIIYSLNKDNKRNAVETTAQILHNVFYSPGSKNAKASYHKDDHQKYGVSPRVRKCTVYNGRKYDFGLCEIWFTPIQ